MKGLSSLERIILECLGTKSMSFEEIHEESGLHENVCFNLIQALIIRGIIRAKESKFTVSDSLSPLIMNEINGLEAKQAESLELIEALLEKKTDRIFRFQKIALDSKDEKIFTAMLSNLDSFLQDAHKKAQGDIPVKERKVVFWGMGEVQSLMKQVITGN